MVIDRAIQALTELSPSALAAIESVGYVAGNTTALIPVVGITITAGKAGSRIAKSALAFSHGGWLNPTFYIHGLAGGLSGASCLCQLGSYLPTPWALPLYTSSVSLGALGDSLDGTFGWKNYIS